VVWKRVVRHLPRAEPRSGLHPIGRLNRRACHNPASMRPITRTALYVFAAFAVLLWITILSVYESRQTPTPSLVEVALVGDFRPPPPSPGNQAHLAVLGLSTYERAEVFRNEILVAGFTCDRRVTRTFHQGPDNKSTGSVEVWNVACQDGHTHSIEVDPGGATKVLSCRALKAMGQVNCFTKC
jgi:hypothetical protein